MVRHPAQPDLLNDWSPPAATVRFSDAIVRAGTIAGRVCRAIAAALRDSELSRPEVAKSMSEFIGQDIPKNMLDAYASQGREDHTISLIRFIALLHATRDRRLLEMVAEQFGWSVIERRHLPMIELAQVQERMEDLRRHADTLKRQTRAGGNG